MRINSVQFVCVLAAGAACAALGQPTFQNLDFEETTLDPRHLEQVLFVPLDVGLPHWSVTVSGFAYDGVWVNQDIPNSSVQLVTPQWVYSFLSDRFLDGGHWDLGMGAVPGDTVSVAQTAMVPLDAQSLRIVCGFPPLVSLGGYGLDFHEIGWTDTYAADVHGWAGQVTELRLSVTGARGGVWGSAAIVASIEFSPVPIPEPGTLTLLTLGGLAVGAWVRHGHSQQ